MIRLIDEHQDRCRGQLRWGIEPIARVLGIVPSAYHAANKRPPSDRAGMTLRDRSDAAYTRELIHPNGPWWGLDDVEFETLTYVDWFNNRLLDGEI